MIRINLLPREERSQRRAPIQFNAGEMVIPVAVLVAAILVITGTALSQHSRVVSLEHSIAEVDAQSRALAPQIGRVNRLQKRMIDAMRDAVS